MLDSRKLRSADVVEPAISGDPLLRDLALPLRRVFHPLGFSVEVVTNCEEVLAAAEESWGQHCKMFTESALQLRFAVALDGERVCPAAPVYRAHRNLLSIVADAGNYAVCDRDQGFASVWLNRDAVEHRGYLKYYFLEAVALSLLSSFYVTPLHAACVEFAGKGVLFCGNSGAGKSSLAFACARAGWKFISDDASYLVCKQANRLIAGNARHVRLRPSARELFPDLELFSSAPWAAGKPSLEVPTKRFPYITTASHSNVEYIIFLNRMPSATTKLQPFPRDLAMLWARQSPAATGDEDERRAASLRNLLKAELLELRYSGLQSAVEHLERLIHAGGD